MLTTDELIAIVGGSLAGLVVILIILSVIIYCTCGRKRDSDKDIRRFHQLTPNTDSSLSKHSTLSNAMDPRLDPRLAPRLPKVGSSGLWLGTPSLYASEQSQGYYMDKPRGAINRSASETRAGPPGHAVYQGNLRIYHSSQQMPTLYEPFQGHLPRSASYMELYNPYGYSAYGGMRDSRAVLVEYPNDGDFYYDPYREREERRTEKSGRKVKRAHSDVTGNTTKRQRQKKRQEAPSFDSREDHYRRGDQPKSRTASVEVHSRKSRDSSSSVTGRSGRSTSPGRNERRAVYPPHHEDQIKTLEINDDDLSLCATDSAKIRAMQERAKDHDMTDKWKKEELSLNLPRDSDNETGINVHTYEYNGDIYSVPEKSNKGHTNPAYTHTEHEDQDKHDRKHKTVERMESNADGKQVTAAFDFLNNYMSDDEGTEYMGSRPHSPHSRHSPIPLNTKGADTYY
ncbi:hypothetical protein KUTeg_003206 [Tegillarca granosa]|uniref:Uncharacterized protein n=1 Tax=Tegillarca granosa TaxID=220873 RepID=A0ABQ9FPD0_TEGGR|nr:hypothetical protein KUTeg_003206 [Tegillarca granosa]